MSTTFPMPTASTHATNDSVRSPVEFVRTMSPEDKEDVLVILVRELIDMSGGKGLIPVRSSEGKSLGYFVPPEAARVRWESFLAAMPESVREPMTKPIGDLDFDDCLSDEELAAITQGEK